MLDGHPYGGAGVCSINGFNQTGFTDVSLLDTEGITITRSRDVVKGQNKFETHISWLNCYVKDSNTFNKSSKHIKAIIETELQQFDIVNILGDFNHNLLKFNKIISHQDQ